jgi:hypothetical protein
MVRLRHSLTQWQPKQNVVVGYAFFSEFKHPLIAEFKTSASCVELAGADISTDVVRLPLDTWAIRKRCKSFMATDAVLIQVLPRRIG